MASLQNTVFPVVQTCEAERIQRSQSVHCWPNFD